MARGGGDLMQSYYFYAAILALKLLALIPMAKMMCSDKMQRANLSDLKHLTPFWLVAALYMTTNPDSTTGLTLLRIFVVARLIATLSYAARIPKALSETAYFASYVVTGYMGFQVMYCYRNAF